MKEDLLKIINHYGIIPQLKYIHSEYFELDEAILENKFYDDIYDDDYIHEIPINHIAEEISDIMVMLKQF